MEKKTFISFDGKEIHYREWLPDNPIGMVQISHGMGEGLSRYDEFAEFMCKNGYLVFGDDHRGHGDTDPDRKGYADGDMFNDTLKDVAILSEFYKEKYPELKLVLFGHSYGSFITQSYIERFNKNADAFILGGSAYMKNLGITAGRVVAKINCFFGKKKKPAKFIQKLSFDAYNKKYKDGTIFISSIKKECEKYVNCQECNFMVSNAFYKSFFSALPKLYVKKNYSEIDVNKPILIISGKDDPVGSYGKAVEKLYSFYKDKVKVKDVEKIIYDNVRHEYLNDISKEQARKDILDYVERQTN